MKQAFGCDPTRVAVEINRLGATSVGKVVVESGPVTGFGRVEDVQRKGDEGVEKVVELVFVA